MDLDLTEAEGDCTAARMAADPDLTERDATSACLQQVTLGPQLAEGLAEDFPGLYSEEQLACLVGQYAALAGEDLQVVMAAAWGSADADAAAADEVVAGLFASCDAPPPPGAGDAVGGGDD